MANDSRPRSRAVRFLRWTGVLVALLAMSALIVVFVAKDASNGGRGTAPTYQPTKSSSSRVVAPPLAGRRLAADTCPASPVRIQKGVAVLWQNTPASTDPYLASHIATYVRSLGANSVSVNFLVSTSGLTGTQVFAGPNTPSMRSLRRVITAAKAAHLRVSLRPLIDETNIPRPKWRGSLRPSSRAAWFAAYGALMGTYAQLAQSSCVDEFVVGSELDSLQADTARWSGVLDRVRAAGYAGEVTYAANWDAPLSLPFAPRSGLDFYPHLNPGSAATSTQLAQAMVAALRKMPAPFLASVVIQETGLSAYGGKVSDPSLWNPGSVPTLDLQAAWFSAACAAARTIHAAGLYYWNLDDWTDPLQPNVAGLGTFAFVTRPAETAVRRCFSQPW